MDAALMIEGQIGLTWERWKRIAECAEECGYAGLYRSDHFTNPDPPDQDSLEMWTSLTWVAGHTQRIEFGPLVSPVSFRHPTITARTAASIDDLSGGRLILGMGAGWNEREHANFGFELLDTDERFLRFEEGLQVVTKLLRSDQPVTFEGSYYHLKDAILLPRPQRPGGPPILIGGNGPKRTLPLAARYADEWNGVYISKDDYREKSGKLDELIIQEGRRPEDVRRSLMTGTVYGKDAKQVAERAAQRSGGKRTPDEMRSRGLLVGTAAEIASQIRGYGEIGVYRLMVQWLDLDDIEGMEDVANELRR